MREAYERRTYILKILVPKMVQNKAVRIIYSTMDVQIFQKSCSHLKILGIRRVTSSSFIWRIHKY